MFLLSTLVLLVVVLIPLADAPDLSVLVAIAVIRIEDVVRTAVVLDVVYGDQMHRSDIAARWRAGKGAVHLVDRLPAMQIERFRNSGGLILPLANAIVCGHAAVAA